MWVYKKFFVAIFLITLFTFQKISHAKKYDPVIFTDPEQFHEQFRMFQHANDESKQVRDMIKNAQSTIDLVTYDLRGDEKVFEIIDSLQNAANRGVRVRFVLGSFITQAYTRLYADRKNFRKIRERLTHFPPILRTPQYKPIEFVSMNGASLLVRGWSLCAGIHAKILLVDGKNPDHGSVIMTGRNLGASYDRFIDSGFVIKNPEFLKSSLDIFNNLWFTARKINDHEIESESEPEPEFEFETEPESESEKEEAPTETFTLTSSEEAPPSSDLPQAAPYATIQPLYHNFFGEYAKHCAGLPFIYNYTECANQIEDPILNQIIQRVREATSVRFYTLGVVLHPRLKEALIDRLQEAKDFGRPFKLVLFTNSKDSHKTIIPFPLPWYANLQDLHDLLEQGAQIYVFKKQEDSPWVYIHRKMAIFSLPGDESNPRNDQGAVIMGSHNLNQGSSMVNDEVGVEIINQAFAEERAEEFDRIVQSHGEKLDLDTIATQNWWNNMPILGWNRSPGRWILELIKAGL